MDEVMWLHIIEDLRRKCGKGAIHRMEKKKKTIKQKHMYDAKTEFQSEDEEYITTEDEIESKADIKEPLYNIRTRNETPPPSRETLRDRKIHCKLHQMVEMYNTEKV